MKKFENYDRDKIEPTHRRSKINHSRNFSVHVSDRMWQRVKKIVIANPEFASMNGFIRTAIHKEILRHSEHFIDDRPVVWRAPAVSRKLVIKAILSHRRHMSTRELADTLGVKRVTIYSKLRQLERLDVLVRSKRIVMVDTKGRGGRYKRPKDVAFWGVHPKHYEGID